MMGQIEVIKLAEGYVLQIHTHSLGDILILDPETEFEPLVFKTFDEADQFAKERMIDWEKRGITF